ncbi:GNAT family N-acetyltransferase [Streptomyces sp. NPDC058423]|uniref:GNAT family N-acetyltransferase n=1 Tax=unclassified Streptomyces TaxID=2593676 RepID=UPI003654F098
MTHVSITEAIRAWVDGWVVSRGAAEPVAEPWGLTVDVGLPRHTTRHVLTDNSEAAVRTVAASAGVPGRWLKVFEEEERVLEWLGPDWTPDEPGFLMTTPLERRTAPGPALPEGHRLRAWTRDGVTRVLITTGDGAFAARGQIATAGTTAVVDQIETAAEHRRKGLGSLVMRTLQHSAAERGATSGVLGGTPDGRALYESLGWRVIAPLVSVYYTPVGPSSAEAHPPAPAPAPAPAPDA